METSVVFEQKIAIAPREFNQLADRKLDDLLIRKFTEENEGRCSVHGWVVPGTLKMLSRTMLQIEGGRFTGDMVCWIQVEGKVLYPVDGIQVRGFVLKKNKMGLFVMHKDAIQVMIPRDLHIDNEEFDNVQIGDMVEVEIKKSRFQVKDEAILSVGLFVRRVDDVRSRQPPAAVESEEEEEEADAEAEDVADEESPEMPPLEDIPAEELAVLGMEE
jgi:hypothetical protein